jgi:hypothetical protein
VLAKYWPACNHGAIILTSQLAGLENSLPVSWDMVVHLESLSATTGGSLLLSHLPSRFEEKEPNSVANAEAISLYLGGLPLVLVGLAGFISGASLSLEEAYAMLERRGLHSSEMFADELTGSDIFHYDRPIQAVFRLALDTLHASAVKVIGIMAMMAPDSIPERILPSDPGEAENMFLTSPTSRDNTLLSYVRDVFLFLAGHCSNLVEKHSPEVTKNLQSRNLVEYHQLVDSGLRRGNYFSIHRSLQLIVLDFLA